MVRGHTTESENTRLRVTYCRDVIGYTSEVYRRRPKDTGYTAEGNRLAGLCYKKCLTPNSTQGEARMSVGSILGAARREISGRTARRHAGDNLFADKMIQSEREVSWGGGGGDIDQVLRRYQ
jgi:hypothetical protein